LVGSNWLGGWRRKRNDLSSASGLEGILGTSPLCWSSKRTWTEKERKRKLETSILLKIDISHFQGGKKNMFNFNFSTNWHFTFQEKKSFHFSFSKNWHFIFSDAIWKEIYFELYVNKYL
jgi:hypothetical protein